jgi:hypothetical protein
MKNTANRLTGQCKKKYTVLCQLEASDLSPAEAESDA